MSGRNVKLIAAVFSLVMVGLLLRCSSDEQTTGLPPVNTPVAKIDVSPPNPTVAVGGTMQNLKLYLSLDRGLAQGRVAWLLSLILWASIAGRLLMGWLADRWAKKYVMLVIYTIVASTIPLLAFAPTEPMLFLAAAAFGVGLGGDYMIIPLMAAELFGVKVLGRVMGVILAADGVAEAVVPMLVASVRDRTGSYAGGFGVLIGLAAFGALAVAALPRPAEARS